LPLGKTASGSDGVIAEHCGLPFTRQSDGRLWHNAGVVGMPANDGAPRVWFSVLTPSDGGILIEHQTLDYDHAATAARMPQRRLCRNRSRAALDRSAKASTLDSAGVAA
jgi:hypothetical protein